MTKAMEGTADIVLIDLEDAVAPDNKATSAARWCMISSRPMPAQRTACGCGSIPFDGPYTLPDLAAIMPAHPGGIMLPKVYGRADVERLDHCLSALEVANGIEEGSTPVIVLITETAEAMFHTGDYKGAPRVVALTWGAEDLADSIGASSNRNADGSYSFTYELARSLTVLGAATAGVHRDRDDLRRFPRPRSAARGPRGVRRDGYRGMLAIHPAQVDVINEAFTPTRRGSRRGAGDRRYIRRQSRRRRDRLQGRMLDRPYLARAERLLRQAGKLMSDSVRRGEPRPRPLS
jgi:citrate lyase subunit beta/citryl-CoA lyase